MKKLILATACVAAMSAFGSIGASAQSSGPSAQQAMDNGMNSNARMMKHDRMMKHKMHHRMTKHRMMKQGM